MVGREGKQGGPEGRRAPRLLFAAGEGRPLIAGQTRAVEEAEDALTWGPEGTPEGVASRGHAAWGKRLVLRVPQGPGAPGRGGGSSGATPRACRGLIPPPAGADGLAAPPAAVFLLPWRGLGRETKIQDAVSWDSGQWVPVHPGPRRGRSGQALLAAQCVPWPSAGSPVGAAQV